jgi:hypothetical protein
MDEGGPKLSWRQEVPAEGEAETGPRPTFREIWRGLWDYLLTPFIPSRWKLEENGHTETLEML